MLRVPQHPAFRGIGPITIRQIGDLVSASISTDLYLLRQEYAQEGSESGRPPALLPTPLLMTSLPPDIPTKPVPAQVSRVCRLPYQNLIG